MPLLHLVETEQCRAPTLAEAAEKWRASRIDVEGGTQNMHRSAFGRVFEFAPGLRNRRLDAVTVEDLTDLVAALHARPYKRETIKKTRSALAQLFDHCGIDPNPARDERVKLPRERKAHIPPPLAEHVERVAERLPSHYVVPFLVIDECGPRVSELETAQLTDYREVDRSLALARVAARA